MFYVDLLAYFQIKQVCCFTKMYLLYLTFGPDDLPHAHQTDCDLNPVLSLCSYSAEKNKPSPKQVAVD